MRAGSLTTEQKKYLAEYGLERIEPDDLLIRDFKKGEMLCVQGSPLNSLMLVTAGRIKVYSMAANGKTLLHCFNDPGKIIGEVEFITNGYASSSVSAATDVQCVAISHDRCREELMSNVVFLNSICRTMAEIITETSVNGASNILYPFETRLCAYICSTHENGRFNQKLTELAEYLGTSYRHLLRTLDSLCIKRVLEKTDAGYLILDEKALKRIGNNFFFKK